MYGFVPAAAATIVLTNPGTSAMTSILSIRSSSAPSRMRTGPACRPWSCSFHSNLDRCGLGPVVQAVTLGLEVRSQVVGSRKDDLPILGDAPNTDSRGAVRRRGGELHQGGRVASVPGSCKGPAGRRVVGLHALQSVHEIGLSFMSIGPSFVVTVPSAVHRGQM